MLLKDMLILLMIEESLLLNTFLINDVNDSLDTASELADLLKDYPCKINLIPFNEFNLSDYSKPSNNRIRAFKDHLVNKGFITTIRSTRGDDIMAAWANW